MSYVLKEMAVLVRSDGKESKKYDQIGTSSEDEEYEDNAIPVFLDEKGGYINFDLVEICKPKYDMVYPFRNGFGCVKLYGRYGFVDVNGNEICEIKYDNVWAFSENGVALVSIGEKYGFIDIRGNEVCDIEYYIGGNKRGSITDRYESFHEYSGFNPEGLATIVADDKVGLINSHGQIIVEPQYDKIVLSYDKTADREFIPFSIDGKMGYLDCNGNVVVNADRYDEVTQFHNGFARVTIGKKHRFMNIEGDFYPG